jgi:hypothetical protein
VEWLQPIIGSFLGTSPVAAISFYWAKAAWNARDAQEKQCQLELAAKDAIIEKKDATISALQESRISDLRAVMKVTPEPARLPLPKPNDSKPRF